MNWQAKAAMQILTEIHQSANRNMTFEISPNDATVEHWAEVISKHAEPLVALLKESKRGHQHGKECRAYWRQTIGFSKDEPCTCGADAWNARVEAALSGREDGPRTANGETGGLSPSQNPKRS